MSEVTLRIGGRAYAVACRPGEEARIAALGRVLDARAAELAVQLGAMGEARLLLSVALTLADALDEAGGALAGAAERAERLAGLLEAALEPGLGGP